MGIALLFLIFVLWGALMTPLSIKLAYRYGLMDYPDQRKIHHDPVPRGAGLVLWAGFMLWALLFSEVSYGLKVVVSGATLVFFAGYIDDMLSMSPFGRLAVHFAAAALSLVLTGQQSVLRLGLYLFWVAGVTNAYNFIDGMNGLALSMAALSLSFIGFMSGSLWIVPVVAMILGILPWNFPKAKTFLGDGGVYLLGYLTATTAMLWLSPMELDFGKLCAALLLVGGVPVIDTLVAITRRVLAGKSPFYPDRGHIHHRLLDHGCPPEIALAILALFQCSSLFAAHFLLKK